MPLCLPYGVLFCLLDKLSYIYVRFQRSYLFAPEPLAVDRQYAGKGLGKDLLSDALRRIAHLSKEIGFAAVMVHAKDSAARDFYFRCTEAFIEFPADSRTLYLPMETVIAAYGDIEQL